MDPTNKNFKDLIAASIALSREGCELAKNTDDFNYAMSLINSKQARLRLVIEFNPAPSVTAEIVRDEDGEVIGQLWQHAARIVPLN